MKSVNYLRPYTGEPYQGYALATQIDMKTVAAHELPAPQQNRFLISSIALVTALAAAVSNGATVKLEEWNPIVPTRATLTTALTGANNDMVFTAVTGGTAGNAITVRYVDPGVETATEVVTVVGTAITVTLRSVSSVLSTAAQVKTAIEASVTASALVTVANAAANTGAGVVIALAATALSGGLEDSLVQTIVASADLADTDPTNNVQALTIAAGVDVVQPGNVLRFSVTNGATATTDLADLLIQGTVM